VSNSQARSNWVAVSFGSGEVWARARKRLFKELNQFDFAEVEILDENWIRSSGLFPSGTLEFIQSNSKGFGYWIWKPYLVKYILQKYPECDGVFYLDVGCEFNLNQESILKMHDYIEIANTRGAFAFELGEPDLYWTSSLVISELNAERSAELNQISATTFLLKNTGENMTFIDEWIYWCTKSNFNLLTEERSTYKNFKSHRHDQSIFSLLWKMRNHYSCPDESYWAPNWAVKGHVYPIWATRNRLSISVKSPRLLNLALRIQFKVLQLCSRKLTQ
jgi:hypothetical protein